MNNAVRISPSAGGITITDVEVYNNVVTGSSTRIQPAFDSTVISGGSIFTVNVHDNLWQPNINSLWAYPRTTKAITAATKASPCAITTSTPHALSSSTRIEIQGVVGMTQLNNLFYTMTSSGASTMTLGVDSSAYSNYASGGLVITGENGITGSTGNVNLDTGAALAEII